MYWDRENPLFKVYQSLIVSLGYDEYSLTQISIRVSGTSLVTLLFHSLVNTLYQGTRIFLRLPFLSGKRRRTVTVRTYTTYLDDYFVLNLSFCPSVTSPQSQDYMGGTSKGLDTCGTRPSVI